MRNRSPFSYDNVYNNNTTMTSGNDNILSSNNNNKSVTSIHNINCFDKHNLTSNRSRRYRQKESKMTSTISSSSISSISRSQRKQIHEEKRHFIEKIFRWTSITITIYFVIFLIIYLKHTNSSINHLLRHPQFISNDIRMNEIQQQQQEQIDSFSDSIDAIIIGSGLAGLTTALQILDRGGIIVLIEKNAYIGGNSNKATSGINSCCSSNNNKTNNTDFYDDTFDLFINDTIKSAGILSRPKLIETLVYHSNDALQWLKNRVNVDLSMIGQLGGHSVPRTYRPEMNTVGIEIIYRLQLLLRYYEQKKRVMILLNTQVTQLLRSNTTNNTNHQHVYGVQCIINDDLYITSPRTIQIHSSNVVLATGGFAASLDRIKYYRPDLLSFPTTAGSFSTGDGITLATNMINHIDVESNNKIKQIISKPVSLIDMDQIQIHPTGFVHPNHPNNKNKILAAEILRGVGGILINQYGQRFCNELGTRDYVSNQMLLQQQHQKQQKKQIMIKTGDMEEHNTTSFYLILSSIAANNAKKHVDMYMKQGLLRQVNGVEGISQYMNNGILSVNIQTMLHGYYTIAKSGNTDQFGKIHFHGLPQPNDIQNNDLGHFIKNDKYFIGIVTPVIHYCMGGIEINTVGNVLDVDGDIIPGLYGVGEVTGGVHGKNRLGGNSLLECVLFGSIIGKTSISIPTKNDKESINSNNDNDNAPSRFLRIVLYPELQSHVTPNDCWIAIHGIVYNVTEMARTHPGGPDQIYMVAGTDATQLFDTFHNHGSQSAKSILHQPSMLNVRIGRLVLDQDDVRLNNKNKQYEGSYPTNDKGSFSSKLPKMTLEELEQKQSQNNKSCYVAIHGIVYDFTNFIENHPAGSEVISQLAGTDGTSAFQTVHKEYVLDMFHKNRIATLLLQNENDTKEQQHQEIITTTSSYISSFFASLFSFGKTKYNSSTHSNNMIHTEQHQHQSLISLFELNQHHNKDDCWVTIDGIVYNVTSFIPHHTKGGTYQIYKNCGKDITQLFHMIHNRQLISSFLHGDYFQTLKVGPISM